MRSQNRKSVILRGIFPAVILMLLVAAVIAGCGEMGALSPASFEMRSERRAFDGAPPVIPHEPLGAACSTCHSQTGMPVPDIGFAPANPHLGSANEGSFENCRQCHVFQNATDSFRESTFAGIEQQLSASQRLFPGAPPVIPHSTFMRGNCLACHSGTSAREEIVCSHPLRTNCQQCHVEITETETVTLSRGSD